MNIEEIFNVEIKGLVKTINDYTTDNYINSYANDLLKVQYPADKRTIKLLVSRLLEWYNLTITEIRNNKYIYNKVAHEKTIKLLSIIADNI